MARCTAPVNGHHSASAEAACPHCRGRGRWSRSSYSYGSSSFSPPSYSPPSYSSPGSARSGNSGSNRTSRPKWARASSGVFYTPAEVTTLTPVRENVEKRASTPDLRDIFLCHAWDDRAGAAKDLNDQLASREVKVWFSENDVPLGSSLLREIDKGLAKSRIGIVLVTPNFLTRVKNEGIAEKELSALLARDLLVPIVHGTTFEALRDESPLLGSRSGLSTADNTMAEIAAKLAELVNVRSASDADLAVRRQSAY